jgi:hypothetical protein
MHAASISGGGSQESGAFRETPVPKGLATSSKLRPIGTGDFGEETVFAGVTIKNTGTKTMVYRCAWLSDKEKNLLSTAAQGSFTMPV